MDDWKGEHLIRIPRTPRIERDENAKVCTFAGCDKVLGRRNISMVCNDHLHSKRCRCPRCLG